MTPKLKKKVDGEIDGATREKRENPLTYDEKNDTMTMEKIPVLGRLCIFSALPEPKRPEIAFFPARNCSAGWLFEPEHLSQRLVLRQVEKSYPKDVKMG